MTQMHGPGRSVEWSLERIGVASASSRGRHRVLARFGRSASENLWSNSAGRSRTRSWANADLVGNERCARTSKGTTLRDDGEAP